MPFSMLLLSFINSQSFNSLLVTGDFNVDFARCSPKFLEEFNLVSVDLSYHANVQFTYEGYNSSLWIDRILSSRHFALLVFKSLILLLISLIIIPLLYLCSTPHLVPPTDSQFTPRTAWHKVNDSDIQNFCYMISDSLPTLPSDLVLCSDPSCLKHRSSLDFYCSTLLRYISDAARLTLLVTSNLPPYC